MQHIGMVGLCIWPLGRKTVALEMSLCKSRAGFKDMNSRNVDTAAILNVREATVVMIEISGS